MRHFIVLFLFGLPLGGAAHAAPVSSTLGRLETTERRVIASDISTVAAGRLIAAEYVRTFPDRYRRRVLASRDPRAAQELFSAANIAEFYTGDPAFADEMRNAFDKLRQLNVHRKSNLLTMYEAYISSEQFEKAGRLVNEFPWIENEKPPRIIGGMIRGAGRKLWDIDFGAAELRQVAFALPDGFYMVVMSSALCHFAQNAAKDIEADPELRDALAGRTLWLSRVDRNFHLSQVKFWNDQHPYFPLALASDIASWDDISNWATPTFYIFHDGRLVERIKGWPTGGRGPLLLSLAKRYSKDGSDIAGPR